MSQMKQFAEQVSVDMGKGGVIDDEVLAEAQKRLERLPSLGRRLESIDNPECDSPYRTASGAVGCPHCGRSIERECIPNTEECLTCEDTMVWDDRRQLYECQNCGRPGASDLVPKECGECGRAWPWRKQ